MAMQAWRLLRRTRMGPCREDDGMARHKDSNWTLPESNMTYESAQLAVLMDLRDELKHLNSLLHCPNFTAIPGTLYEIRTAVQRKKRRPQPAAKGR